MLFDTLLNPGSGMYLMQQHYTWNGPLKLDRLVEAWDGSSTGILFSARPTFRKDLKRPLQVVQRRIDLKEAVHAPGLAWLFRCRAKGPSIRTLEDGIGRGIRHEPGAAHADSIDPDRRGRLPHRSEASIIS